jgi:capsular exopolysaccharide synthesis family protein
MKNKSPILIDQSNSFPLTETYRSLVTNIRSYQPDRSLKTLLVTSAGQGEGKSTIVANLGITFALAGSKVLLVDSDLRSPALHRIFNLTDSSGLTNILIDIYDTQISQGTFRDFSMRDILQLLKIQKKTGILTAEQKGEFIFISFEDGKMVGVGYVGRPVERQLGTVLIRNGKITSEMLDEALHKQQETHYRLGFILVNMGLVKPQDIEGPLKLQITEDLQKMSGFKMGTFNFQETRSVDYDKDIFDVSKMEDAFLSAVFGNHNQNFIEKEITSFIKDTHIENLKLLTCGSQPPNPPELLASERMKATVKILKDRFDILIFDSPPATTLTDAPLLASFLDGVILVIQKGLYDGKLLQRAKEALEVVRANIYGVVLNQVDFARDGYYGYYQK